MDEQTVRDELVDLRQKIAERYPALVVNFDIVARDRLRINVYLGNLRLNAILSLSGVSRKKQRLLDGLESIVERDVWSPPWTRL